MEDFVGKNLRIVPRNHLFRLKCFRVPVSIDTPAKIDMSKGPFQKANSLPTSIFAGDQGICWFLRE